MTTPGTRMAAVCVFALAAAAFADGPNFRITLPAGAPAPVSGRVVVALVGPDAALPAGVSPLDAPFREDPQPMYGLDVRDLGPGKSVVVGNEADAAGIKSSQLKPGDYKAATWLVSTRRTSNWRQDAGNLFSEAVRFTIPDKGGARDASPLTIELTLTRRTGARPWPDGATGRGIRVIEIRSGLLSDFHKRDVMLRAAIVPPTGFDPATPPTRKYAAIYTIPGFGSDHFDALKFGQDRQKRAESGARTPESDLDRETFIIVPDPESPNGHTLFADSANNGPCGRALVEELIPELDRQLPLMARPEARIVTGGSSGGWSSVWLGLTYPEAFGAVWAAAPDPVDFRSFGLVNIYTDLSMYVSREAHARDEEISRLRDVTDTRDQAAGRSTEWPVYRKEGKVLLTVREENAQERVLGPGRSSGQQWASWQAVFGAREADGSIAPLFDELTGAIRREGLEGYLAYDIGYQLRSHPARLAPLLLERVRLIVGAEDNFYLQEAVQRLKDDLARVANEDSRVLNRPGVTEHGYITIVPGRDHASLYQSDEFLRMPREMLEHLREKGLLGGAR